MPSKASLSGNPAAALIVAGISSADTGLRQAEENGNFSARLALLEEAKSLPWGAVWDEFCRRHNVPVGAAWLAEAEAYGQETARLRS
jgi:L-rhamnose isomerase